MKTNFRNRASLKDYLDTYADRYNQLGFIENDPILIPHLFTDPRDIEIAGFFAAILAWGQRRTIIAKCRELMERMDNAPYDFVMDHRAADLRRLDSFRHRTFNGIDTRYFVEILHHLYREHDSLEHAFRSPEKDDTVASGLIRFHQLFFSLPGFPERTRKHVATPERNSTCKRLNMYLRWMVRRDDRGVDFGLWKTFQPAQLLCPCDVHVDRVARSLGLIRRRKTDWQTVLELTAELRLLDPHDPVRYDFALFGMGIDQRMEVC